MTEPLYGLLVIAGILTALTVCAQAGAVYRRRYHAARRQGRREALQWSQEARTATRSHQTTRSTLGSGERFPGILIHNAGEGLLFGDAYRKDTPC